MGLRGQPLVRDVGRPVVRHGVSNVQPAPFGSRARRTVRTF